MVISRSIIDPSTQKILSHQEVNWQELWDSGLVVTCNPEGNFIHQDQDGVVSLHYREPASREIPPHALFIGIVQGRAIWFLFEAPDAAQLTPQVVLPQLAHLSALERELVLTSLGLVHFQATVQGATPVVGGRFCLTSDGKEIFPRLDPAIIVAITSPDDSAIVLAQPRRALTSMYSLIAGFVEVGETLEQTVQREVYEELGIRVANVRYEFSQPWPFPQSLMLGFFATCDASDAQFQYLDGEIARARWFNREQISTIASGGEHITIPPKATIAGMLINRWLEGG